MVSGEICGWKRHFGVSEIGHWAFKRLSQSKCKSVRFRQGGHLDQGMRSRKGQSQYKEVLPGDLGENETGKVNLVKIMEGFFLMLLRIYFYLLIF